MAAAGDESYYRCRHCRGFFETSRSGCKWCSYETPVLDREGSPKVFPDRETCRAIQLAEFEQLPPEAHEDCMGPPRNDLTLLCNCLHCGPEGHTFEAIEMRWMPNERMWACPCTTCGGRGFSFDIHSAENKWQCSRCGHFYLPENKDYHSDNAKCPKCGCTEADGWFDDDYDEEDFDDQGNLIGEGAAAAASAADLDEELPWDDEDDEEDEEWEYDPAVTGEYDLGITWKESDGEDDPFDWEDRMPDDIDHPRIFEERDHDFNDDDIPF